jgi:gas vesicle protein
MQKRDRNMAVGALIAAGLGYAAGILTAPKSGRETRKDIQRAAIQAKTEAEKKLKKSHSELNKLIDECKQKTKSAKKAVKEDLDLAIAKATKAKQKARVVLSAVHEGDAEDKDLQKAIVDVNKAIKHLRTFLVK